MGSLHLLTRKNPWQSYKCISPPSPQYGLDSRTESVLKIRIFQKWRFHAISSRFYTKTNFPLKSPLHKFVLTRILSQSATNVLKTSLITLISTIKQSRIIKNRSQCNCKYTPNFPLEGYCQAKCLVYKATVKFQMIKYI